MRLEYVCRTYGVPAEIGRRVIVYGKPGIIAEDRGHYIGVNFDCEDFWDGRQLEIPEHRTPRSNNLEVKCLKCGAEYGRK
jgi:hypothetical protein